MLASFINFILFYFFCNSLSGKSGDNVKAYRQIKFPISRFPSCVKWDFSCNMVWGAEIRAHHNSTVMNLLPQIYAIRKRSVVPQYYFSMTTTRVSWVLKFQETPHKGLLMSCVHVGTCSSPEKSSKIELLHIQEDSFTESYS